MHPRANKGKADNADSNSRRNFLKTVTAMGVATVGYSALPTLSVTPAEASEIGPVSAQRRSEQCFRLRLEAAVANRNQPIAPQPTNSDEDIYPNRIGSFSKTLPHNLLGEVVTAAYEIYLAALASGQSADFERIPLGGTVKLANPQASYAFDMLGPDGHHVALPAAPSLNSAQEASEMAEDYWAALTRDVPFNDYGTNSLIADAAANLSRFSDFRGPKENGQVTADTIFRGFTNDDLNGPYISQFLWKDIPFGATTVVQKYRTAAPRTPALGGDYMTSYSNWLNVQNGSPSPVEAFVPDTTPRYIRSGRDISEWLHRDFSYQGPLGAALILISMGPSALDDNNPYKTSHTQTGAITLGAQTVLDLLARVTTIALKACWFQKWLVHRRVRPEEFGGLVHNHITHQASYPLPWELISGPGTQVLDRIFSNFGSYLLPMAYPEGCPLHPAYPAGHAVTAGACNTVLKWFFNESRAIPSPVVASSDGTALNTYTGHLTVGGELNKLASNASIPRDTAGVHWRTDGEQGMLLGEAMAIGMLQDLAKTNNEQFAGLSLTKFDGNTVTITGVSDDA